MTEREMGKRGDLGKEMGLDSRGSAMEEAGKV